jgi:iron complex transport system substrate-binding protein
MVIASVPYGPEAIAQILRSGVRVLALSPRTLDDIYDDIFTIAALMQVSERGRHVVDLLREEIERIRTRTAGLLKPRVYVEEWGKPMLTAQPWVAELVQAAGGEFVGTPASPITAEEVRSFGPEVIVFAWCGTGDGTEDSLPEVI